MISHMATAAQMMQQASRDHSLRLGERLRPRSTFSMSPVAFQAAPSTQSWVLRPRTEPCLHHCGQPEATEKLRKEH